MPVIKSIEELDHGDLRAQRVVDGGELEPDDAAADHQQPLRDLAQLERGGRVPHARIVVGDAGDAAHPRAGGEDRRLERDLARASLSFDGELARAGQLAGAHHHLDPTLLRHPGEALGQPADHAALERVDLAEIEARLADRDPLLRQPFDLAERLGQMEQRLRWNAADVETDAAERRVALDQRHALAEIGGAKRGGVAAGARAEDEDVGVVVQRSASVRQRQ